MDFDPSTLGMDGSSAAVELDFRSVFVKGSMDIVPADWQLIAEAVAAAAASDVRGIIVLHGTDTMQYTAAALSFMVQGLSVPLVITGSMKPGGDADSDAPVNLRNAVEVAAFADLAEVCVVFSGDLELKRGLIIRGSRARKVHSHAVNAFDSINVPPIGVVEHGTIKLHEEGRIRRGSRAMALNTALDSNVVLIKLTPNLTPAVLARQIEGASGIVLEGTGLGHIRRDLMDVVVASGRPTVMSTQAVYGGERLGAYESDKAILAAPNIIPGGDMLSETALVKLMWALKQRGETRTLMMSSIAGEVTEARSAS